MTNFWDVDGDFDYEAHYEAGQRDKAADTAAWIGHPGMTDAIYYFGLQGRADSTFTPELLSALDTWQVQLEKSEATRKTRKSKSCTDGRRKLPA